MKRVEILKLNEDATQSVVAFCELNKEGKVVCQGDENIISSLQKEGIRNYISQSHEVLFPDAGVDFLKQLPLNFNSGYFQANVIEEEDKKQ